MVRYVLHCDEDHRFEAWYRSQGDSDRALAAGPPVCPVCERATLSAETVTAPPPSRRIGRPAYQ